MIAMKRLNVPVTAAQIIHRLMVGTFAVLTMTAGCALAQTDSSPGITPQRDTATHDVSKRGTLNVVVTSKPIHALVADVMRGVGVPYLLVDGMASPHTYAMKPSDAQKVQQADVFFRVSEALEPFTEKVMQSLPASVQRVTLADAEGVNLLKRRTGGTFDQHQHSAAEHTHHQGSDGPRGSKTQKPEDYDAHVWLDPINSKAMVSAIATILSKKMPGSAAQFNANATDLGTRIDALSGEITRDLAPVASRPFVVFHDAYQYFENRFGLAGVGSITVAPDVQPSARRLSDLRQKVKSLAAVCVFSEPHLQQKVISSVIEGTTARTGTLDPEGMTLDAGPELYFKLMRKLAADIKACLMPTT